VIRPTETHFRAGGVGGSCVEASVAAMPTVLAMDLAATLAAVLLMVVAIFQIALALGTPLGDAALGGRHTGVLPIGFRVASAVAGVVVYPFIVGFVLASAGLITADWIPGTGAVGMWVLVGFFTVGALANFASRSKRERVWGPVPLVIAVCCGVIAVSIA